jgi:hypothetical protein
VILHTSGLLDVAARRPLRAIRLAPENGAKNFGTFLISNRDSTLSTPKKMRAQSC